MRITSLIISLVSLNLMNLSQASTNACRGFYSAPALSGKELYPRDYQEARERFRRASDALIKDYPGSKKDSFAVPNQSAEDLTIDSVFVPARSIPKKLIVLTSGIHGAEGPTGSALQLLFLRKFINQINHDDTGVLIIHSLNPFGFEHGRRVDQNGVDLNRNMGVDTKIFETENNGYKRLRPILEPKAPVKCVDLACAVRSLQIGFKLATGTKVDAITQAVGQGQYSSPEGIMYGGNQFQPQTEFIKRLFGKYVPNYENVIHLDFHTGLGKKMALQLMTGELLNPSSEKEIQRIFGSNIQNKMFDLVNGDSDKFYHTHGDIIDLLAGLFPDKQKNIVALTVEFGTIGNSTLNLLATLNRLVNENQGVNHGYKSKRSQKTVETAFAELFNPSSPEWRDNVISKSNALFDDVIKNFSH